MSAPLCRFLLILLLTSLAPSAFAQVPGLLNYQGRVAVGTNAFDGIGQFKLALVNTDASQTYWRNSADANSDGQPDSSVAVTVTKGMYAVVIGDTSIANMAALPADVFSNSAVYLRVWFNDGVNGFQRLAPDQRLTGVAYAMVAASVPDGSITTAKLASGTLHASNLAGTLNVAQVPNLDASKLASGTLSADRLPSNLAYRDTDLSSLSNALTAQIATLASQIASGSSSAGSGLTFVSSDPQDATLIAKGLVTFMSVPAPVWSNGTTTDAPSARSGHSAVWSGQEMIVWGGSVGVGSYSSAGSMYRPDLDSWTTVSTIGVPGARSRHVAVWTGQEMLIWGGFSSSGYQNTGGRFAPAQQLWTSITTTSAPAGREGHVAAWTGSRMVVWGGRDGGGLLSNGALYNPTANQWTALTVANPPSARMNATAVWTGSRFIVWGGDGASDALNTGAQLLIDANGNATEWRSVSATGAPSARSGHTAVWTGLKMIIFGGQRNGVFLNDGAAYDPATDSWQALATSGAPSARSGHAALWTGQEMVVVGGDTASGAVASGAAYSLSGNRWRSLSSGGNPQARSGSAIIYSGSELLVFGGQANGQPLAALQRLNPQPTWYFYRQP